jgi:hypothetical protein
MTKPIKDITVIVSQMVKDTNAFPKDVKIKSAKIETDDWGTYYISIDYVMDDITFNITERVFGNLSGAVNSALWHIKERYEAIHQLQQA